MRARSEQIGFSSQRLRLSYLEYAAHAVQRQDWTTVREDLNGFLQDVLSGEGSANRGSRQKMTSMLLRIWGSPPAEETTFGLAARALLRDVPAPARKAVHWGMTAVAYPFWAKVAEVVGRLFRLQDTTSAVQVRRRVQESSGDREIVARASRCVLSSFLDWGVLLDAGAKGLYRLGEATVVEDPFLTAWLLEACLRARRTGKAPLKDLFASPMLFPFRLQVKNLSGLPFLAESVEVIRHGWDEDMLGLRASVAAGSTGERRHA